MATFGNIQPGWPCVQAICEWVHQQVTFGYQFARPNRTALEVSVERMGFAATFSIWRLPCAGPEYSGTLRDGVSGRYRCAAGALSDGFQRVV